MESLIIDFSRLMTVILLVTVVMFAHDKSSIAFTISESELIPEGFAYDGKTKKFYVGSTYLGKIVSIDVDSKVKEFTGEAQDDMRGVLGLCVDEKRRLLWAISDHLGLAMPIKNAGSDCIGCLDVLKYDLEKEH